MKVKEQLINSWSFCTSKKKKREKACSDVFFSMLTQKKRYLSQFICGLEPKMKRSIYKYSWAANCDLFKEAESMIYWMVCVFFFIELILFHSIQFVWPVFFYHFDMFHRRVVLHEFSLGFFLFTFLSVFVWNIHVISGWENISYFLFFGFHSLLVPFVLFAFITFLEKKNHIYSKRKTKQFFLRKKISRKDEINTKRFEVATIKKDLILLVLLFARPNKTQKKICFNIWCQNKITFIFICFVWMCLLCLKHTQFLFLFFF